MKEVRKNKSHVLFYHSPILDGWQERFCPNFSFLYYFQVILPTHWADNKPESLYLSQQLRADGENGLCNTILAGQ